MLHREVEKQKTFQMETKQRWDEHTVINQLDKIKNGDLAVIIDCGCDDFFLEVNKGRENAPPAFDLCSADKGQPPVRERNHRQPGEFDKVAGRFSRLYGGEIPGLGAWRKRQQDGPQAYPHPAFQAEDGIRDSFR